MLVLSSWGKDRATRGFTKNAASNRFTTANNNANCYVKRGAFAGSSSLNSD